MSQWVTEVLFFVTSLVFLPRNWEQIALVTIFLEWLQLKSLKLKLLQCFFNLSNLVFTFKKLFFCGFNPQILFEIMTCFVHRLELLEPIVTCIAMLVIMQFGDFLPKT